MVNLAADSWTKYCTFNLKSRKNSCPKKVVFIFCQNFAGDFFFRCRRIFVEVKTEFSKVSRSHTHIPISRWCYGEHFEKNQQQAPILLREMVYRRTKYNARTKYSAFRFHGKNMLRIKIQRWFFYMMYMNASPLGISKKITKIYFGFWLISFC